MEARSRDRPPGPSADTVPAKSQPGVIGSVKTCSGSWCRLIVAIPGKRGDVDGYIRQDRLWGVYPNERVE